MERINNVPKLFSNIPSLRGLASKTAWDYGLDIAKEVFEADESSLKACAVQSAACFMATLPDSEAPIFQQALFQYTEISGSVINISEINAVSIFIELDISKSDNCEGNWRKSLADLAVSTAIGLDIINESKGRANPRGRVPIGFFLKNYRTFEYSRDLLLNPEMYFQTVIYSPTHGEDSYQQIEIRRAEMFKNFDDYVNSNISSHHIAEEYEEPTTEYEDINLRDQNYSSVFSDSIGGKDSDDLQCINVFDECSECSIGSSTQEAPEGLPAMTISQIFNRWVEKFADKHKSARSCNRRAAALMIDTLHLSDSIPLEKAILPQGWSDSLSKAIYDSVNTPRTRRDRVEATKNFIKFMSPVGALKELESWNYSDRF